MLKGCRERSDGTTAMKARISIVLLAAIAAIAAVLISTSGGGGGALDPLAQAAETTTHAGGVQMSLKGSVTAPGLPSQLTFSGEGSFNFKAREGALTMTIAGLPASVASTLNGGSLQITELFKAASIYVSSPLLSDKLPGGAHWVKLNLARFGQAIGLDPSSLTSGGANPTQYLQYLKAAGGSSSIVGHDAVRGIATTHYAGKIDLLKAAEAQPGVDRSQLRQALQKLVSQMGLRSVPVDVWIDAHGLVRKVSLALSLQAGGQQVKTAIDAEYHDFGPTQSITAPPASEVFDMTQQTLQSLSSPR
jgi:hypothetical protein